MYKQLMELFKPELDKRYADGKADGEEERKKLEAESKKYEAESKKLEEERIAREQEAARQEAERQAAEAERRRKLLQQVADTLKTNDAETVSVSTQSLIVYEEEAELD